jgi:hypothetical protein
MDHDFTTGGACRKCGLSKVAVGALGLQCNPGETSEKCASEWDRHGRLVLVCENCGARYQIAEDAFILTTEIALARMRSQGIAVMLAGDDEGPIKDLVASIAGQPPGTLERAQATADEVADDLRRGRAREWRCRSCNRFNPYPAL